MKATSGLPFKVASHLIDQVLLYMVVFEGRFRQILSPHLLARSHGYRGDCDGRDVSTTLIGKILYHIEM